MSKFAFENENVFLRANSFKLGVHLSQQKNLFQGVLQALSSYFWLFTSLTDLQVIPKTCLHRDIILKISEMDSTIELDDSSVGERTIVLDSTNEESKKNETIDLDSTNDDDVDEQNGNEEDHFTTAASNTNFLDSPPKITSTPNIQLFSTPTQHPSNSMFHEVEDEFAHDDSFGDEVTKSPIDNKGQTSEVSPSTETPVGNQRQISSEYVQQLYTFSIHLINSWIVFIFSHEQSEESDSDETDDSHDESVDDNDQYQRINDDSEEEEDDDEGVEDEEEKEKSFVDQMTQRPNMENPELPSTCTMITTPQGAKVFIVGTAHFSRQSHDDVSTIMKQFLPDVVVLELCKSRTNILSLDEETLLAESESLDTNKVVICLFFLHFFANLKIVDYSAFHVNSQRCNKICCRQSPNKLLHKQMTVI